MRKTVDILGVNIDSLSMQEAVACVNNFLYEEKIHTVFTPNAEIVMAAHRDPGLKHILTSADLVVADGAGVVLASRILGRPVPEKVSGIDLVRNTLKELAGSRTRYFLLGSRPGVAEDAGGFMEANYPGVEIAGFRDGYFTEAEEEGIIALINSTNADILLVALGAPRQEKWIYKYRDRLNVRICMGVGGTLDVLSGKVQPTPEFLRRNGFEWLYRLYKEPWRAKRMLDLPRFVIHVIRQRLSEIKYSNP